MLVMRSLPTGRSRQHGAEHRRVPTRRRQARERAGTRLGVPAAALRAVEKPDRDRFLPGTGVEKASCGRSQPLFTMALPLKVGVERCRDSRN